MTPSWMVVLTLSLTLGLSMGWSRTTHAEQRIGRDGSAIAVEGRMSSDGWIAYPGAVIAVAFRGRQIEIRLEASSDQTFVDVILDDQAPERFRVEANRPIALTARRSGLHRVEIHKRTEAWQGLLRLVEVKTDGSFVQASEPSVQSHRRKLLFIGDSITAGSGSDATVDDKTDDATVSNGRLSYGRVLADRLDAACHLIAYGGKGLIRDYLNDPNAVTAPQFYERTLPDDPGANWDATKFRPDVVVIALGTNDFNVGIPPVESFVPAMVSFIDRIATDAPDAKFVLLSSPMFGEGDSRTAHLNLLRRAAETFTRRPSGPEVRVVEMDYHPGRPSDSHPIADEHVLMANQLEPIIRGMMHW